MTAATDKAERTALAKLSEILTYVAPNFFMPVGLARGLGRKLPEIKADLKWLIDHGFVAEMLVLGKPRLYVTHKGWMTDVPTASSSSNNEIVFTETPRDEHKHDDEE